MPYGIEMMAKDHNSIFRTGTSKLLNNCAFISMCALKYIQYSFSKINNRYNFKFPFP